VLYLAGSVDLVILLDFWLEGIEIKNDGFRIWSQKRVGIEIGVLK